MSRPGWKFRSLPGSQSVVCGIHQQLCSSTRLWLPPTCSMTFLWAVFSHFLDSKRHNVIWRQCICAVHSKQSSMRLKEVHILTCIKTERYREELSAILILLDLRSATQKSLEFNPRKGKGTKPQRAGSLSAVVLLHTGFPKVIQNRLSMLSENKLAKISKGKLLHRSTNCKLPNTPPVW